MKCMIRTRNYRPIWKKHLNCRITLCILEIISKVFLLIKVYLLINFWSKYICSHRKLLPKSDAYSFWKLVNIWWKINNSKQKLNTNLRISKAAVKDGKKTLFLREFVNWLEDWQSLQSKNSEKFTLSKQTNTALVITLQCIAPLIEDLLMEKIITI